MVQRVGILLMDDLNGSKIPAGKGETVPFALDGKSLRAALRPYVDAGRPIKNKRGRRVTRTTVDADPRAVKEWARANG